jgi:hypothetical protein
MTETHSIRPPSVKLPAAVRPAVPGPVPSKRHQAQGGASEDIGTPGMMPAVLALPCGVTRSSRALPRSVAGVSPSSRNAIAHDTARFRTSTDGSPTRAAGGTAAPGAGVPPARAGAGVLGGGPAPVARAPHARHALTAITAGRLTALACRRCEAGRSRP